MDREHSEGMVQRITHNDRLLAIIVPRDFGEPGQTGDRDCTLDPNVFGRPIGPGTVACHDGKNLARFGLAPGKPACDLRLV